MGREVRRVPLNFDWPLNKVWGGFLLPDNLHERPCDACGGTGYSDHARALMDLWYGYAPFDPTTTGSTPLTPHTPAVRAFAERNVANCRDFYGTGEAAVLREAARLAGLWNGQWCHHLDQDDVDALVAAGRLYDLTHTWANGVGWQPIEPAPIITATQVNEWSMTGMGHDSSNCAVVVEARCARTGQPKYCTTCAGQGSSELYPGQRADADAWTPTDPPAGEGWQLWETVSEGSPISPVFATDGELAAWMADPKRDDKRMPQETTARFVAAGWAPSFVWSPQTVLVSGAEYVGLHDQEAGTG